MSQPFELNGTPIRTPDSFVPSAATTSTNDSDRTQDLVMHNTPIGTIESYEVEWKNIPVSEAAFIYNQIKNRQEYSFRYMSLGAGAYRVDTFYTSNYSVGTLKQVNGGNAWESFKLNAIRIHPV